MSTKSELDNIAENFRDVERLRAEGKTLQEAVDAIGVSVSTFNRWKKKARQHLLVLLRLKIDGKLDLFEAAEVRQRLQQAEPEWIDQAIHDTEDLELRLPLVNALLEKGDHRSRALVLNYATGPDLAFREKVLGLCVRGAGREARSGEHSFRLAPPDEREFADLLRAHDPLVVCSSGLLVAFLYFLGVYAQFAPRLKTQDLLEAVVNLSEAPARSMAIALLGHFGEIDTIERVCMLPITDPRDRLALHRMIDQVTSRPVNMILLRPAHFESLMKRFFERQGYTVKQTRLVRDDGVDLDMVSSEGKSVLVQCKRYSPETTVQRKDLEAFDVSIHRKKIQAGAVDGAVFVTTTAKFSRDAVAYLSARERAWTPLDVIDGASLCAKMDRFIQKGKYCVKRTSEDRDEHFNLSLFDAGDEAEGR